MAKAVISRKWLLFGVGRSFVFILVDRFRTPLLLDVDLLRFLYFPRLLHPRILVLTMQCRHAIKRYVQLSLARKYFTRFEIVNVCFDRSVRCLGFDYLTGKK